MKKRISIIVMGLLCMGAYGADLPAYKDQTATVSARVEDLMGRMTLEEKIVLCGGVDTWFVNGIPRLGIPKVAMADGSTTGVKGSFGTGTVLPSALALAATWDRDMAKAFGRVEAHDCKAVGYQILLGPAVNLARSPLLGRNTEYFGEDPYLAGVMGVEIIKEIQSMGIMGCIKHFVANDIDLPRTFSDSIVDERTLRELYLLPFEMGVKDAKVATIMGAYNHVNGQHACVNKHTLQDILRNEWGFDGIVLSDWGAGSGSAETWAMGPLDLAMPNGPMADTNQVLPLITQGKIDPKVYDAKVRHILTKCMEFGFYDKSAKDPALKFADEEGARTALQVAREGMVLLKNQKSLLPLNRETLKSIALLGPHSQPVRPGVPYVNGPSGSSALDCPNAVTILKGVEAAAGKNVKVVHVPDEVELMYETARYEHLDAEGKAKSGLVARYYKNNDYSGTPALERVEENLSAGHGWRYKNWLTELRPFSELTVRWEGQIRPAKTGDYRFVKKSNLGAKVWLGDEVILDDWAAFEKEHWMVSSRGTVRRLEGGKVYPIKIEYRNDPRVWHMVGFQFGWGAVDYTASVKAAKDCDVAVVCVGYDYMTEGEGFDRTWELPYGQAELIRAVAAANPRTVVVLTGGGACETAGWFDKVPAMLQAWYLGQNGATAVGEILFGAVNPSGKLPLTFAARYEDNPSAPYYKADWSKQGSLPVNYTEGVFMGYRGFDKNKIEPLFPFGYGLSYTQFKYSNLAVAGREGGQVLVTFDVRNTGKRAGAEVVQLYVGDNHASVPRPPRELKGFTRVELKPGESLPVSFMMKKRDFCYYDITSKTWKADHGKFDIAVGASSRDLRLLGQYDLTEGVAGAATAKTVLLPYKNPALPVDKRVKDLLGRMTVEEKVAQLQCQMAPELKKLGQPRDYTVGFIRALGIRPKAVDCAKANNEDMRKCVEETRLGIPVLNHEETLHAVSTIPSTLFPNSLGIAATWDEDVAYRAYRAISDEGMAVNIRHHYSPCLYFCRDPRWGRMEETYGEDPFMATRFGLAYVKAIRDAGAVPTLKGYPVNYGDAGHDSFPRYVSEREYRQIWLVPWEAAVRQYGDVMSIMPAYSTINDIPVHADHWLLTKILRDEWGYKGFVSSDYGDHAKGLVYLSHLAKDEMQGSAMLLEAGLDSVHPNGGEALPEAARKGVVTQTMLDRAVSRVLRVKFLAGLFERPYADESRVDQIVRSPAHQQMALETAQKAAVLLKNEKGLLPFKKSGTVGVFGPAASTFFSGGYGRYVMPSDISPLKGLQERVGDKVKLVVHDGKSDPGAVAKGCDVALVFCTIVEGEAFDRSHLNLPVFKGQKAHPQAAKDDFTIIYNENNREFTEGDQESLIRTIARTGVPTVVILVTGSPVTMQNWIGDVSAVVQMWYGGEKGGLAIADILFGDVNPGGRLPVTFPRTLGQVPIYYSHGPLGRSEKYWDDDGKPQFPFGFGLSYTTFEYSKLKVESSVQAAGMTGEVTVSVDVKNTGSRAGDEVVQVYVSDEQASVARPGLELKGFERLTLNPGEQRTVTIRIPARELALWNLEMKRVIEPGLFKVMIGRNAEDILLQGRFEVK